MATKHFLGGRIIHGTEFSGYKYRVFEPSTSTPKTSYKVSALTVGQENADPIVLDANGACQIWFNGNADVVFYTSADVVVYSDDDVNLESSSSSAGSYNSALNGSFEDDADGDGIPDNWTRTLYSAGAFTLDTTTQSHGDTSAKFTSTGTGGGYLTSTANFAVKNGSPFLLSWDQKGTADVRNVVQVFWYQASGAASATASTTVLDDSTTNPTSWTRKSFGGTVPSDAYFGSLVFTGCHSSDATAGSTWFDNIAYKDLEDNIEGSDIAAANVTSVWDGFFSKHITGTGTITSLGTSQYAGQHGIAILDGSALLVSGTNFVLPGTSTVRAEPGDSFGYRADSTTQHDVLWYTRASGKSLRQPLTTNSIKYTATGTHTAASDIVYISGAAPGGGGGDANTGTGKGGSGGGAGEWCLKKPVHVVNGSTYVVTLGTVAAASAGNGSSNGGDASDTTFGSLLTLDGGHGGVANGGAAGAGGTGNGCFPGAAGGVGAQGGGAASGGPGADAGSFIDAPAGSGNGPTNPRAMGLFGIGGIAPATTATGGNAVGYGSGGSGGSGGDSAGGVGAPSIMIVEW